MNEGIAEYLPETSAGVLSFLAMVAMHSSSSIDELWMAPTWQKVKRPPLKPESSTARLKSLLDSMLS